MSQEWKSPILHYRRVLAVAVGVSCWVAFVLASAGYVRSERVFYYWDNHAYNRAALESLSVLQTPGASWFLHLRQSMQSGFSQLFTVAVAPVMLKLGEGRTIFIGTLVGIYLFGCVAACTLLVHRMLRLQGWEWLLCFVGCATLPVIWRATLAGYPDIGGIMTLLLGTLLLARDVGVKQWRTAVGLGVILATTFLFRRHLAYAIVPLMVAASIVALSIRVIVERNWRGALTTVLRLATATLLTILIIWIVAPSYFHELVTTNFKELYSPYQFSIGEAVSRHAGYVGVLYWVLATGGLTYTAARHADSRGVALLLIGYALGSMLIWLYYLRYLGIQYNLHFSCIVAVGVGVCLVQIHRCCGRPIVAPVLAGLLVMLWADRLGFIALVPERADVVLPSRFAPQQNPDYGEIRRLIDYLREHARPPRNVVHVAASSATLNSDMLTIGEGALYGQSHRRLIVMNGSHVDTVQPYPLRDLIAADWILVAEPFQHHLREEEQGVVLAAHSLMGQPTQFSRDFRKSEVAFTLAGGIHLRLFERIAPTDFSTQLATAREVFEIVGTSNAWNGPFMMGEAATGAEYFDARLINPEGNDLYTVALDQVRLKPGQTAVTLFVRVAGTHTGRLTGQMNGAAVGAIHLRADLFSDQLATGEAVATFEVAVEHETLFALPLPPGFQGVLALRVTPQTPPPLNTPLGFRLEHLTLQQSVIH